MNEAERSQLAHGLAGQDPAPAAAENLYLSVIENLPQRIFRKDVRGRFTFANRVFCNSLGKELGEILGKTDFDFYPPELAAKYHQDDLRVLETLQPQELVEAHRAAGERIYVQVVKTPVRDSTGKVVGIQGIFWDVTERKRIEEQLAYERDLLRSLLEHSPDSIYFKDRESRFLSISKALARRFGLSRPEEAVGKTDFHFLPPDRAQDAFQDEQRILATGQPLLGKLEKDPPRDGQIQWVLTTKVPLHNKSGEIIGTFGISKDITALKQAEIESARARDAALESARLKSEFLANMSHEIRTPMNAILGMSGLLLDTPLSDEQRDFAETIRSAADSLLTIINDILDFSKIEAGKLALEVIDFDLADLIETTVELFAEQAQTKNIELVYWIKPGTPTQLRGDPGRVRQVLTNLLGNAVKFTDRGEVVLEVEAELEDERHATLRFSIRDTGVGIPWPAQPRIFQAFTQGDGSLTRKFGGTGLGLAISKQLVQLLNGRISFKSAPGQGSTFWVAIPFDKQPQSRPADSPREGLEGVRVLIVDDNGTNRQILHHQVIGWKMRNGCADSGPAALRLLEEAAAARDPYDLVILDMQMPGMDGLQVARAIARHPTLSRTRVIILTSLGRHLSAQELQRAGIAAYLVKPVKPSRLFDCLAGLTAIPKGERSGGSGQRRASVPTPSTVRVLVAEDNPVNQKVTVRQLAKLGYHADAVANGLEALEALRAIPYAVILMDCQMPDMDGYEATRRIRNAAAQAKPGPVPYIIAMTANALAGDREECLGAGMNDYLSKPIQLDQLRMALDRARASPTAPPLDPASLPALDRSFLDSLRDLKSRHEPDPLAELIRLFLLDTPARLETLRRALHDDDFKEAQANAHCLKGSSSNLGAQRLAAMCHEFVDAIRQGQHGRLADMARQINQEFATVRSLLESELGCKS